MSTNIHFVGTRAITYTNKAGSVVASTQEIHCGEVMQTTTKDTANIMAAEDKKQAYIDVVRKYSSVVKYPQYAADDIFCERDPVGYDDYDWTVGSILAFEEWWAAAEEDGYTITAVAW